jgi:glucose-1-phosphate adenylyltransferase
MTDTTLAIILAGGSGSRLDPLTRDRTKPAVPFGGKYRIIDFTLANCLHSGVRRVLVLTQYKSHSLQKHLRDGWSIFNPELGEYITSVPPQMRTGANWYAGTADAIYQSRYLLERSRAELVLILAGDHIYRMDYAALVKEHRTRRAELSLVCMDVDVRESARFGVLSMDADQRVVRFEEKPQAPTPLAEDPSRALVSMGIYLFDKRLLIEALERDSTDPGSSHDFGRDIIPALIGTHRAFGYRFGGTAGRVTQDRYWRDVGTLDAYYEANMALLDPVPPLDLYQPDWTIRTYQAQHPPARTVPGESGSQGVFINSIVAGGVIIAGGGVHHSVLFPRVRVDDGAIVEDAILFEGVEVGPQAQARHCIVEKGVHIPAGAEIGIDPRADRGRFVISDKGVVVIPKDARF